MSYYIKLGRKQVEISDWAGWVACDPDGTWFEYKNKPVSQRWHIPGYWGCTKQFNFLSVTKPPKDWTLELYQIEREK